MDRTIEHINTTRLSRSTLSVYITRVKSPTLFWIQLEYKRRYIREMEEDLKLFMLNKRRNYTYFPHAVTKDAIVAVKNGDNWSRGRIIRIEHPDVTIYLGDWGKITHSNIDKLYQLPKYFFDTPWQAIRCGINNIRTIQGSPNWSTLTKSVARSLMQDKTGWIRIRKAVGTKAVEVDLGIAVPGKFESMSPKDELIRRTLAEEDPTGNARPYPSI